MVTLLLFLIAVVHALVFLWGLRLYLRRPSAGTLLLITPIGLLVYDTVVVALGAWIGEGSLLKLLSYPRHYGHAFFTPVWIVTAVDLARRAGVVGMGRPAVRSGAWILLGLMITLGVWNSVIRLDLAPELRFGVLDYTNAGRLPGPPIPALVMVVVTLVCGALVWRRFGWPWMFAGAAVMFLAAAVPLRVAGPAVSSVGEVVLGLALVTTEAHVQQVESTPERPAPQPAHQTGIKA